MENTNAPAISVIIPMYNVEKYIGECLDSLFLQTFQDFEVIVVNDCSTDNSFQIAESYLEKFNGRLKIFTNEKNSGPSTSRNNGLLKATGEYVFFMDSDDLLLLSGLEEMYTLAKKYDIDFIDCPIVYEMTEDGKTIWVLIIPWKNIVADREFTLDEDLKWRVNGLLNNIFCYAPWRRFLRRDFLIENKIFFPESVRYGEDQIWTHSLLFYAKKILHVSYAWYVLRLTENSLSRTDYDFRQNINLRVNCIIEGLEYINKIMDKVNFFVKTPEYRPAILEHFAHRFLLMLLDINIKVSQAEIYSAIKELFGAKLGKHAVLVAELCSLINDQQKEIRKLERQLKTK